MDRVMSKAEVGVAQLEMRELQATTRSLEGA